MLDAAEGQEVNMIDIQTKLFVDEFFNTETKDIVKKDFKQYDLMNNAQNEAFLTQVFQNPPVILPIQNLGEVAFIF